MAEQKDLNQIRWKASEYVEHHRGSSWYLGLAVITVILTAATYLLTHDKFGAGIIALLGIIVGSSAHWKPNQVTYVLSAKGLHVGTRFYPFSQFKYFDVVHEGELHNLVFVPTKRFATNVTAFVDPADEEDITALVGEHLPMQPIRPDRIDILSRRLRF
jgi:hypothetical protein